MNVKEKTFKAASWHFAGQFTSLIFSFTIGVILARLLSPAEFGIVGLATVFISITSVFVDSGFGAALIQKRDCTERDYSTVFYFNIVLSAVFYLLIFSTAHPLSLYFKNESLTQIIRVLGLTIIINSFNVVQQSQLTKVMNFKIQTIANFIAVMTSGLFGIYLAYHGFGVWSLVWQTMLNNVIILALYWKISDWRPRLIFSFDSLKSLFSFGSKLLITGIMYRIYSNLQSLVIAKFYSPTELGLYTRANRFQDISSRQLSGTLGAITFPLFSTMQDDLEGLKRTVRVSIKTTMLVSTYMTVAMLVLSKVLVLGLIGVKWSASISYLHLLCIYGVFVPISPILTNVIQSIGKSKLLLKLEVIKRGMDIPVLIIGAVFGIKEMIIVMIIVIVLATWIAMIYVKKEIGYTITELISDIIVPILISLLNALIILIMLSLVGNVFSNLQQLIAGILISIVLFVVISEVFSIREYISIRNLVMEKVIRIRRI